MKRILVVAAEESASLHALNLLSNLKKLADYEFTGIGSHYLNRYMDIIYSSNELAFVGLEEPKKLFKIVKIYRELKKLIDNVDGLILIDYPGMNLKLARYAKKKGKKVCYFVAPQVWAWGRWRIKSMKTSIDGLLCLFPFEEEFFSKHGINARFFGHPLHWISQKYKSEEEKSIVILPGSRESEIKRLLPVVQDFIEIFSKEYKEWTINIIKAPGLKDSLFANLSKLAKIYSAEKVDRYSIMSKASLAISASGTATLELALLGIPTIVIYKVFWITFYIAKLLANVNYISITNILAQEEIFPECLQNDANGYRVYQMAKEILEDSGRLAYIKNRLNSIKKMLEGENVYKKGAEFFHEILYKTS